LDYTPSLAAQNLKRGRSQLIALVVSDLANPFFARIVCAAEAAVAAWGYSLVLFNSDERPESERRILARIRMLACDGVVLVPVGASGGGNRAKGKAVPFRRFCSAASSTTSDPTP
jgi:LacI family transcriptional regulator